MLFPEGQKLFWGSRSPYYISLPNVMDRFSLKFAMMQIEAFA